MSVETVARRYGTALADVVGKTGEVDSVRQELKTWEQIIAGSPELQSAFSNPSVAHQNKENILNSLLAKTNPSKTSANFLRVLLQNGRLTDLQEINAKFDSVLEERSGVVAAHIISARDLSETEKADLRTNIEKLTGRRAKIDFSIDQEIIGGVVTRIGSTVYDSSVKTQLNKLREELING